MKTIKMLFTLLAVILVIGVAFRFTEDLPKQPSPQVPELQLYKEFAQLIPVKAMTIDTGLGTIDQTVYVGVDTNIMILSGFGPAHRSIGGTNYVLAAQLFGGTNHVWVAIRK